MACLMVLYIESWCSIERMGVNCEVIFPVCSRTHNFWQIQEKTRAGHISLRRCCVINHRASANTHHNITDTKVLDMM